MSTMTEPNYRRAIAAAYKSREKFDPGWRYAVFDPFLLTSVHPRMRVCKYTTFAKLHGLEITEMLRNAPSYDGFTLRRRNNFIIVYNDAPSIPETRKRFTVAHELGHVVLQHKMEGDDIEEREADCFARNLLAPRRLALKYGVDFRDYPKVFGISAAAARMCERFRTYDEQYI